MIINQAYIVYEPQKLPLVKYLLQSTPHRSAVVFCGRKQDVKQLARELQQAKMKVAEIHSDLEQSQREEVLQGFCKNFVAGGQKRSTILIVWGTS